MARSGKWSVSAEQKEQLWQGWKQGISLSDIARKLDGDRGVVHEGVAAQGGFAPVARKRSRLALSLQEREEISRGIVAGTSIRALAQHLKRAPSTISRELRRNRRALEAMTAINDSVDPRTDGRTGINSFSAARPADELADLHFFADA